MKYNKFVAPVMAGALTFTLGLVGCGGNNAAPAKTEEPAATTTTETTEVTETTTTNAAAEDNKVMFWQGETDKGDSLLYSEDDADHITTLLLFGEHDESSEVLGYSGPSKVEGDNVTISDTETGKDYTFTITDRTDASMTIDLGEHGKGTIKPVTQKEFQEGVDSIINGMKEVGEALESLDEQDLKDLAELVDAVAQDVAQSESTSTTK